MLQDRMDMKIVDHVVSAIAAIRYVHRKITEHSSWPTSNSWAMVPELEHKDAWWALLETEADTSGKKLPYRFCWNFSTYQCSLQEVERIASLAHSGTMGREARTLLHMPHEPRRFRSVGGSRSVCRRLWWSPHAWGPTSVALHAYSE